MRKTKSHKSCRDRREGSRDGGDHREAYHAVPEKKDRGRLDGEEKPGEDRDSGAVVRNGREQRHL